jgi:hypothetical protein
VPDTAPFPRSGHPASRLSNPVDAGDPSSRSPASPGEEAGSRWTDAAGDDDTASTEPTFGTIGVW